MQGTPPVVHPLALPSAQPVVLLQRVDEDLALMARYRKVPHVKEEKEKEKVKVEKVKERDKKEKMKDGGRGEDKREKDKEKEARREGDVKKERDEKRERVDKKEKLKDKEVKHSRHEGHQNSKPLIQRPHNVDEDFHESKLTGKHKSMKRKANPVSQDIVKKEAELDLLPHKQRRVLSPLEKVLEDPVKLPKCPDDVKDKRKLDLPFSLKKSFKEKRSSPIPKLEDGQKPVRVLESRRGSSESVATQSPCAMLYSAEPRKSYYTKADGSETNALALGCRAPSAPTWLEDLLYSICRWDPRWLQESRLAHRSKAPNILPAKEMREFIKSEDAFTYRFETLSDYQKHFRRALLLQFWDDVSVGFTKKSRLDEQALVAVDRVKSKPLKGGKVAKTFYCHCGINDKNKDIPIRSGDLVVMKITATEIREVFAYAEVSGGSKELLSNTVSLSPLLGTTPDATHKFSFRMVICVEELSTLLKWEPSDIISCRISKIGNFYDEVEVFKFVQDIFQFPKIMDLLMNPSAPEENTEYLGLKSCSDMSTAQKKVISAVIKSIYRSEASVNIVEGAPGTGKSRLVCALAQELAEKQRRDERDCRVIIAGKTNRTLAGIMKHLLDRRVPESEDPNVFRVVRLGSNRHTDDVKTSAVEALAERQSKASEVEADKTELRKLEQERRHIERTCSKARKRGTEVSSELTKKLALCTRKLLLLKNRIQEKVKDAEFPNDVNIDKGVILKNADIIVTPASVSQERNLVEKKLSCRKHQVLILDDAAEITEPAIIKLIVIFNVTDIVLVGDKQNHVPFTPNFWARKAGLSVPLIQRYSFALDKENASWHTLIEQRRMHPMMLKGLEPLFDPSYITKSVLKFPRQAVEPFMILNCTYIEKEEEEVDFIEKLLDALQKSRINLKDVGFTTFSRVIFAEGRRRAISQDVWKAATICKPDALSALQFKVMIVSCGLSPSALRNSKATTVALTRAQRALFICGNFSRMEDTPEAWEQLLKASRELEKLEDIADKDITSEALLKSIQTKTVKDKEIMNDLDTLKDTEILNDTTSLKDSEIWKDPETSKCPETPSVIEALNDTEVIKDIDTVKNIEILKVIENVEETETVKDTEETCDDTETWDDHDTWEDNDSCTETWKDPIKEAADSVRESEAVKDFRGLNVFGAVMDFGAVKDIEAMRDTETERETDPWEETDTFKDTTSWKDTEPWEDAGSWKHTSTWEDTESSKNKNTWEDDDDTWTETWKNPETSKQTETWDDPETSKEAEASKETETSKEPETSKEVTFKEKEALRNIESLSEMLLKSIQSKPAEDQSTFSNNDTLSNKKEDSLSEMLLRSIQGRI